MGNVVQCSQIDTLQLCVHDARTVKNHYPIVGVGMTGCGWTTYIIKFRA